MIAEETRTLTFDEKLNSGNWKARLEAYEEFLKRMPQEKQALTAKYKDMFPKFLIETTPSAMEKGLQVVCQCLRSEDKLGQLRQGQLDLDTRQLFRNLVEKIFAASKPNLAAIANELLCAVYEVSDKDTTNDCLKDLIGQKNPKVAQAAISASIEILVNFGPKETQWQNLYQKILPKCSDPNPQIRTLAMDYFKSLGQYQGESVLTILKSLKPVQLNEIKSHIDSNPRLGNPAKALLKIAEAKEDLVKGNGLQAMQEEDLWQHMPAIKVLHKFNEAWTDKLISETKWTEKKQKLESMEQAFSVPKIELASYTHIAKMLKKMLSDSNVAVHMAALAVIKKLCKGLRTGFSQGLKSLNRSLLLKLKERKPLVTECVIDTVVASFQTCGIEDLVDEYRDQMKERNPQLKCNLMKILDQYIIHAGLKCLKHNHFCKTVLNCAKDNLNDGSPEVRKASTVILANLFRAAPKDHFVIKEIEKIDEKRRSKILELSKASATASVCGSVTNQRSPTQEISYQSLEMKSHLKKSQSVSRYPTANMESLSPINVGKKSVPQLTTDKAHGGFAVNVSGIAKPAGVTEKVLKKSQSTMNLMSQPTLTSLLDEMKNPIPHEEATMYLTKESSIPTEKINQLSHSSWKLRQQALIWFKNTLISDKLKDPQDLADEAVMVLAKKHTNDFKESNINIVKELVELASSISKDASYKAAHLIVEAMIEKLPLNKFSKQIDEAFSNICQNNGLRRLITSFLGNAKEKTANPRITASTISKIKDQIIANSEDVTALPYRELVSFCKGSLLNPNTQVRHSSLELLSVMIHFNKDINSMISDVSSVQKSMINSELCKLNTLLNTSTEKDLNKTLVRSIMEDDSSESQMINLQLLVDNFKQKKGLIPEDMRDQFFKFIMDSLDTGRSPAANLCLEIAPILCRKYRREFEKFAEDLIKSISVQVQSLINSNQAVASLQGIFDCLGGPIFAKVPEFAALSRAIKSKITRMQYVQSETKMQIENIDLDERSIAPRLQTRVEVMDLENLPESFEGTPSGPLKQVTPSRLTEKLVSEKNPLQTIDRVFKPVQNSPQKSAQEVPWQTQKETQESAQSKIASDISGKRSARRSRLASKDNSEHLMTLEDVGSNLQWKKHTMDYNEPKDDQVNELRRLIKAEMGDDLADMMFSYEKSRIIEAAQKVETRMKQKCELSGFWEIMLKWALVRVYDCSRDEILKEFGKFVVNIINFSDRGGRHLVSEEANLMMHIQIQIVANEDECSVATFASTFGYHLFMEHKDALLLTLLQTIIPEPYKKPHLRSLDKCVDMATRFIQTTKSMIPETIFSSLVNVFAQSCPEVDLATRKLICASLRLSSETTKTRLKGIAGVVGQCVSGFLQQGDSYIDQFEAKILKEPTEMTKNQDQINSIGSTYFIKNPNIPTRNSSYDTETKPRELTSTLKDLKADIESSKASTDLKNVITLKKIVDLVKSRNDDSDNFLRCYFVIVIDMISYMIRIQLMNDAHYTDRITSIQSNFEFIKTVLEYVQKICGSPIILKSMGELRYTNLVMQLVDCLVVVDADRRLIEANQDDLYTDRAIRIKDTMSKFINSAILRLMEGPPNMVLNVLFGLLTAYSGFHDRDPAVRETKAIRLKIISRCIIKLSSVIESMNSDLNLSAVLQMATRYLEACQIALCLDNDHMGVKTVKTVIYDIAQAFPDRVRQELIQMETGSQAHKLVCHWTQTAIASPSERISNIPQQDYLLQKATPISETRETQPEAIVNELQTDAYIKKSVKPDISSREMKLSPASAMIDSKPAQNSIPLPMPGMPFRSVGGLKSSLQKPDISADIHPSSEEIDQRHKPRSQDRPTVAAPDIQSRKKVPAFQMVDRPQTTLGKASAQRGSVSDYSQYKESFLRSSVDKDSISEIPIVEENQSDITEVKSIGVDEKKVFQSFGQKSDGSPKSDVQGSSEKKRLVEPVKYIPSEVASLGKRSTIEKLITEETIICLESPVKLLKNRSPFNSGKLSIDLKERKSSSKVSVAARIFEDIDREVSQPNSDSKKIVLTPIENQRSLFSTNLIASNISPSGSAVKETTRSTVNLVDMKYKFKQNMAEAKDQTLMHLITRFKKSMLIDYRQRSKEIHDYLSTLPRDRRPALADYLQDLSVVQKSYLMNELSQSKLADESRQDENTPDSFNEVCEKLAQIRQKYQPRAPLLETPQANVEEFTESLEYKAREKRIGDFRQKIHELLRQKELNLN